MTLLKQQFLYIESVKENISQKHNNRKNYNQYFTPEVVVKRALEFIPKTKVKNIIDPAVGNGVFLLIASKIWNNAELFGIDVDSSIIQNLEKTKIPKSLYFINDSLLKGTKEIPKIKKIISNGGFDIVMGNPPFSSWFNRIKETVILADYRLAYRNGKLMRGQAIEVLFLELFVRLAKEGGYVIIILPDGILSNPQYRYVRKFLLKETKVKQIINLPRNIFRDTSAKTSILILQKSSYAGRSYYSYLYNFQKEGILNNTIKVKSDNLIKRMDYYYYDNLKHSSLKELKSKGIKLIPLKNLIVYCKTGKTLYGAKREFANKGLRFLHATNITEIGINYKKDQKFVKPSSKMDFPRAYAKVGDILFVRVGVGCAGRVAIIDDKENEGVATDYIHIVRVKEIDPYFLVIYLKTEYGKDSINLLRHGVGTVSINKTDLLSILIPVISQKIQKEIGTQYKKILEGYRLAIINDMDLSIYKRKTENLIFELENFLQE